MLKRLYLKLKKTNKQNMNTAMKILQARLWACYKTLAWNPFDGCIKAKKNGSLELFRVVKRIGKILHANHKLNIIFIVKHVEKKTKRVNLFFCCIMLTTVCTCYKCHL